MTSRGHGARRIAYRAALSSAALMLAYVEAIVPPVLGVQGVKLGLPNAAVMLAMYTLGPADALAVSVSRILLAGILFGSPSTMIYAAAGGILSFLVMVAARRVLRLGVVGCGAAGGVAHNIGQLAVAALIVKNIGISYLAPPLIFLGLAAGLAIGFSVSLALKKLSSCEKIRRNPDL